MQTFGDLP